ncbi:MAG: outer membrane protein assembly factor BamA [Desulfobacteraceae bacterium]|nr:outer membrane protein assembly factor BamA [Desulfobacteraceae bacterium]
MKTKQIFQIISYFILFFAVLKPEFSLSSQSQEPIVSEILIKVTDAPGKESYLENLAANLVFLKQGKPFSAELLDKSLEALKLCKKFEEINIDSKEEPGKITLVFSLKPFQLIKDIKIDNAFPLFTREILNAMTIYTGDAFVKKDIPKQKKLVTELFKREGYIAPKAEITAHQDPKDGYYVIYVSIDKGPYYSLRHLDIQGNREFSNTRLKLRMKEWASSLLPGGAGRFVEENLKNDVKNLTEYYRKKGYPDVEIDLKIEKNTEKKTASVIVDINEGSEYEVEFNGNEEFWDYTLKKNMVFFKQGNKNDTGIKKSIREIKERYRNSGYLEADVKLEETEKTGKDKKIRLLRFDIAEGPCSVVESVGISGNNSFDEKKIKKQILTRVPGFLNKGAFVPEILDEDLGAIKAFYLKHGYMSTQVKKHVKKSEDKNKVTVNLDIDEGVQILVSSVRIIQDDIISEENAYDVILLKQEEPFQSHLIKKDENALSALVSEKGHPHIIVKGEALISEDQSEVSMTYDIKEGPHVKMGQVYYSGNFRTKEKILDNEVEVEPGEPFSLVSMLETQKNIRDMDTFDSVQFKAIGLKERADKVTLIVDMEEKKPYYIEAGIGYDTENRFKASAKAGDHNLFGANKDAWISGEIKEIGYDIDLGITEPRLLGSKISATLSLFSEQREEFNQDFGTRTHGASVGFNRKWLKKINTGLNFSFKRTEEFERDSSESYDSSKLEPNIFVTTPSVSYDTRDSFVRPRKGIYSSLSVDISKGLENSMDNFFKYKFDSRIYWTPVERLNLACYGRVGYIDHYDSTGDVPTGQLFFLGGTSDVRGFSENMLRFDDDMKSQGGRSAVSGSVEARVDLGLNFEFTGFYDVGRVGNIFDEEDSGEYRSSVGAGLRYITPIGPVGFLYGFKLDPKEGESRGRLHFTLGYTF